MTDDTEGVQEPEVGTEVKENLHESEEIFRLLVQSVREYAIFLLDTNGYVKTWNSGAERLKGYREEEIVGQHFSQFYPPEVPRDVIAAELDQAIAEGQFRGEGWRVRKDGSLFWADVTITPIRDSLNQLRGFAKVTRDMTARKVAEEERAQLLREQVARQEAQRANRMKDEFLATLSHELRTPLNAILGWSHLLAAGGLDEPTSKKAIQVIQRNAIAQNQLISDMLDISRIEAGKVRVNLDEVDLGTVVEAAIDAVSTAAAAKGIRIEQSVDPGTGPIKGDAGRLQQVVWNLLSNAVKFTPRGGRIDVSLRHAGSRLELVVADTGTGISPGFLPYIFEPFRQADGSPSREHGGLGLGLAIVRRLVELHGGRVSAQSEGEGRGAVFTIEFPMPSVGDAGRGRLPPDDLPDVSADSAPRVDGLRVLVVGENDDSRRVIQATLERLGATVGLARSVEEALDLVRAHRPDVVLSDDLPQEADYELVRRLRGIPASDGGLVPAVALTARPGTEARIRTLGSGFQMHLAKPVEPVELATSIATLAARVRNAG